MSNLASNPWSFVNGDVNTAAITSLVLNSDGTVTLTCTGAPTTPYTANQFVTIINAGVAAYNGFYMVITQTSTTVYQLAPQPWVPNRIPAGTGAAGAAGNVLFNQYNSPARVEDISWQGLAALSAAATLDIRDRNGNVIWQAFTSGATPQTTNYPASQNRGKLFWVQGVSLFLLPANTTVLMTIN